MSGSSGRVVVSFMTDEDGKHALGWPGDAAVKTMFSINTGAHANLVFNTSNRQLMAGGPGAMWPSVFSAGDDGHVWLAFGRNGTALLVSESVA